MPQRDSHVDAIISAQLTGVGEAAASVRGSIPAASGGVVRLLVRHSAVRLYSPTSMSAQFRAKVLGCAFRGRCYEHALIVSDGSTLDGVFAEERSERGENVGVRLEAKGCFVFLESEFGTTDGEDASLSPIVTSEEKDRATRAPVGMRA